MGQSNGHHRNSKQSSLYASVHGSFRHSVPFPNPHVMDLSVIPQATGTYERPVASNCLEYERPVASNCYEYERPIPSMNTTAIENSYEVPKRLRPSQGVQPSMDEGVEPQMYEMSVPLPKVQVTVEVTVEEASPYENPAHKPPPGAHKASLMACTVQRGEGVRKGRGRGGEEGGGRGGREERGRGEGERRGGEGRVRGEGERGGREERGEGRERGEGERWRGGRGRGGEGRGGKGEKERREGGDWNGEKQDDWVRAGYSGRVQTCNI